MFYTFKPYVPVATRRRAAAREMARLKKSGHVVAPIEIEGRKIATTFWGNAWCTHLESYSDYANRLPRGRTYVRNGSVVDLQIAIGQVTGIVSGSSLYKVSITIAPLAKARWRAVCEGCAGAIDSLVELLQGRLSKGVMQRLCDRETGLFPSPREIEMECSCPDWASMCKHVAAVLYGVGARLDREPRLLFRLRDVDELELVAAASANAGTLGATGTQQATKETSSGRSSTTTRGSLAGEDLSALFGLELTDEVDADAGAAPSPAREKTRKNSAPRTEKLSSARSGTTLPTPAPGRAKKGVPRGRKRLTARATALQRQRDYLALLRDLEPPGRALLKKVAQDEGVAAAIALGKQIQQVAQRIRTGMRR